ncbi:hypothetical protein HT031_005996 [Scenedesmus sp. PABB004]|nr:hypothetical protein HT031_005996 [Scenedesmus sp. PABB004]
MGQPRRWTDRLAELQDGGVITGFALVAPHGACEPATGPFAAEVLQGAVSPALAALVTTFYDCAPPPTAYELWGAKLLVVHQTDGCFVALSRARALGLVALNTPGGVLLASFGRGVRPAAALAAPAGAPPVGGAAAAAAGPPTPLEQRRWQRGAQRAVRLAVTAFRARGAAFADAHDRGTGAAAALTNALLAERYLPAAPLPPALAGVPGLAAAAAAKLRRRQRRVLRDLEGLLAELAVAVAGMAAALADVERELPAPCCAPCWAARLPVFHTLSLPEAAGLLRRVLAMYEQELGVKASLLASFAAAVAGGDAGGGAACGDTGALRGVLTAAVAAWLARPCIDDEAAQQLLGVLTDEMAGF